MKPVIGMISYLPETREERINRAQRLARVLFQIKNIFNMPVHIVAQNWHGIHVDERLNGAGLEIDYHDKPLGIVGARRVLRDWFLNSEYDYIIMLDDDADLVGDSEAGSAYLQLLEQNPKGWMEYKYHLMKLLALSKYIYSNIDIPSTACPEGELLENRMFEDMYMTESLNKFYKQYKIKLPGKLNLDERSDSAFDKQSTWHKDGDGHYDFYDRHFTGNVTRRLLATIKRRATLTNQEELNWMLEACGRKEKESWDADPANRVMRYYK